MVFKFVALFAFVAAAGAVAVDYHQPQYYHQPEYHQAAAPVLVKKVVVPTYAKHQEYPDAPAKYEFNYAVNDEHTGDVKSQQEYRDGDNVHGSYSLIDADGFKRTVEYTADEHNGFQATVHREPLQGYKAPVVPVQKYVAAPVVHKVAVPVAKIVAAGPLVAKYDAPAYYSAAPAHNNYYH